MKIIPLVGADMQSIFFDWNSKLSSYAPKGIKGLCIAIVLGKEIVLVDTGIGQHYVKYPKSLNWKYRIALGKRLRAEQTVKHQLEQLGYSSDQVSQIVMTHLHVDHSAGLRDFPNAKVTVFEKEYQAANKQQHLNEKITYYKKNWSHKPNWSLVKMDIEKFGFRAHQVLSIDELELYLVHLPGHCKGHCGIFIQYKDYKLFHCADSFLTKRSLTDSTFEFPWHFRIFRNFIIHSDKERRATINQLKTLLEKRVLTEEEFTCSHDEADIIKQQRRALSYFG